ncbi:hypothetical protein ACF08N_19650 [Streptomyces sp. NPDC015127]|uniref:hypothetical protein n=1 Tax=Streptomyces sp. NPDC015127 TaxID=3364939 RepID=UPI003703001B
MNEFLMAAVVFPTVFFSAALVVVVAFWALVLCGAAGPDLFDSDADLPGGTAAGLGGVPVTVAVSLLVAVAWFTSLAGSVALRRFGLTGVPYAALACAVLAAAALVAWVVTRRLVRVLAKLFPDEPGPSRQDFVGMTCTVRTGRVDTHFGQAEVTARDGSTAVVQVRQLGGRTGSDSVEEPLTQGATGLLYAYDEAGEFFWVTPYSPFGELPGAARPTAA